MSEKESLFAAPGPKKSTDQPEVNFYWEQDDDLQPVEESKVDKDALEEEMFKAVEEGKDIARKPEERPKPKITKVMVQRLRQRDRHFNKTCASCGRRVLLDKIQNGKSEVCDDCRG